MRTSAARQKRAAAKTGSRRVVRRVNAADILGEAFTATASSAQVPAKWSWHHRVMLGLRSRLLRQRGGLLTSAAEPIEPHSLDQADSATNEFDHDLGLTQLSAQQDALYELEEALQRIKNGNYGVCEETGRPIPAARLRAIPWTRFRREVEERLEKKGAVRRARVGEARPALGPEMPIMEDSKVRRQQPRRPVSQLCGQTSLIHLCQ